MFITTAMPSAMTSPVWPPSRSPIKSSRPLSAPSSTVVFTVLRHVPLPSNIAIRRADR